MFGVLMLRMGLLVLLAWWYFWEGFKEYSYVNDINFVMTLVWFRCLIKVRSYPACIPSTTYWVYFC